MSVLFIAVGLFETSDLASRLGRLCSRSLQPLFGMTLDARGHGDTGDSFVSFRVQRGGHGSHMASHHILE